MTRRPPSGRARASQALVEGDLVRRQPCPLAAVAAGEQGVVLFDEQAV
ncbi:hypothetical protein ACFY1U_18950 [Streptomyces sp. NPDC001351]